MAGLGGKFDAVTATTFPAISGMPMNVRVIDIRVRAGGIQALAAAMGVEISRANAAFRVDPYASTLDTVRALARSAVQASPPVQVVQNLVLYGIGQMSRLAAAALVAVDAVLADRTNPNSVVVNDVNVRRLTLALQAVELAEQIQTVLLRIFNALQSSQGTSGLGDLTRAGYIMGAGFLFGIVTGGATIPIAMFLALAELLGGADTIIGAIQSAVGKTIDSVGTAVRKVVEGAAAGAGDAAGVIVKYALIIGSVLVLGAVVYNYAQFHLGKAVMKSPTGRKLVGAAVGGPAGASLAANRRRSSRRRRTSRKAR